MQDNFLAVFGHVVIDITMRVDRLPTSGSVGVNSMVQNFGGTAGNFAMIAARLDYPFHLYSAVGGKSHSQYITFLDSIGVDTSHLVILQEDMGPIGYAVTTGEEQIFYFYQGPMENSLYDKIKPSKLKYEYVHFGTGLPADFIKFSKITGDSKIVFDPGQEISYRYDAESLSPLLDLAYLTILNKSEFDTACRLLDITSDDLIKRCRNLIITKGKEGSELYEDGKSTHFFALHVENPYDTIGAGDSFRAGLYLGLWNGFDLKESVMVATVTSSEAIMKPFSEFGGNSVSVMDLYKKNRDRLTPK